MNRIIILDTSGLYAQIYDEIYCDKEEKESMMSKYQKDYMCIVLDYDKETEIEIPVSQLAMTNKYI